MVRYLTRNGRQSIDEMLEVQVKFPSKYEKDWCEIKGWGLGFAIEPTDHGIRYSHGGDNGGFSSWMYVL